LLTRAHFMPFLNHPVELDMADGTTRRGILHTVTNDGVYLRPMNGTRLVSGDEVLDAKLMGELDKSENIQEAFFPFFFLFPFFFIRRFRFRRRFI
jgi:hypothetical protein